MPSHDQCTSDKCMGTALWLIHDLFLTAACFRIVCIEWFAVNENAASVPISLMCSQPLCTSSSIKLFNTDVQTSCSDAGNSEDKRDVCI